MILILYHFKTLKLNLQGRSMKNTCDYKSRFRILKGGKISLVVSALLVGSTMMTTTAHAEPTPSRVTTDNGANWSETLTYTNTTGSAVSVAAYNSDTVNGLQGRVGIHGQVTTQNNVMDLTNNANITGVDAGEQHSVSPYDGIGGMYIEAEGGEALTSFTAKILNNGQITLTGDEMTFGLGSDGLITSDSFIKNAGTIDLQTSNEEFPGVAGIYSDYMGNSAKIENTSTGIINLKSNATTFPANMFGMYGGMAGASTIQNDGKISIEGIGAYEGEASVVGIAAFMEVDPELTGVGTQSVVNNGDITIKSSNYIGEGAMAMGALGIQAMIAPEVTGATITNNGNITLTGHGFLGGIMVVNDTDNATVTNGVNGKIYVNSEMTGPGQLLGIASMNAPIVNDGIIEATIGGTLNSTTGKIDNGLLDASAASIGTQSVSATVTNSATGQLNGNLDVTGALNNAGIVRLPHNAQAAVGTFTNTGTLEIGVLTDGDIEEGTVYSQLMATNATFSAGSKINVNVLSTSTSEELLIGDILEDVVLVDGEGSSLTVDGLTITDNSSKLNFERVINDDTSIDLLVLQGQSYQERSALGGANAGTQSAAAALEAKGIDFVGIVDGDDVGFANAVTSTTPVTTMAANTANTQIMNGLQGIVEMRQNNVMSGMNSGDMTMVEKNLWAKVYGSMGQQDDKNGMNGFDVNSYGIGIGADAEVAAKQRIGAALFYTRAQVDVNNMNQNTDLDVYTAMVYGNVKIAQNTDFLYQAGYTWQKTASERVDFFADRYTADFTSKVASLDLKLMQTYKMDNALTLRPLVETTYRHFTNPSYNENGTGTAGALSTEKFTSTQMIASAGAIAEYKTTKDSQIIANLHVGYDFHHDEQAVTSSYAGGYSFTTDGIDNGGWQYDIGMGYETANILGGEINFMYNYQGQGSSFDNHVLSAKYVYKF